ncbi:MAG: folate-binding protein YgfZ [Alphaproteobacteria bacterium]|nr:folate-binding protein YgfZ [Alphaproteobacteria bacterium]
MSELVHAKLADRGLLTLVGEETRKFLQGLVSNDVEKVTPAHGIYAALLSPQGKFLHDFFILEWRDGLILDCEAERRADLQRRLTLYRLRSKVRIGEADAGLGVHVAFGDGAAARLGLPAEPGAGVAFAGGIAMVDPRLPGLGLRLVGEDAAIGEALQAAGFRSGEASEYHRLRVHLGVPDGSRDLPIEKAFLLENNFEELNGVDFRKGCYVGQELTARTKYRGLVRKRLFRVDGDRSLPPAGTPVMAGDKEAGILYSALERQGLALLRLEPVQEAADAGTPLTAGDARLVPVKPAYARF